MNPFILSLKLLLVACLLAAGFSGLAAEAKVEKAAKAKSYPLKSCLVSDEKLGDMGDPYVFTYKSQEIKLCCKGCLKDFNKEPKKYLKKIEDAAKEKK